MSNDKRVVLVEHLKVGFEVVHEKVLYFMVLCFFGT